MSECCNFKKQNDNLQIQCKKCGETGKSVKKVTLEHLLKEEKISSMKDIPYFFCSTPNCSVVYFSKKGESFYKKNLKVRVGLKEKEELIPVCYCFDYSKKIILDDVCENGKSTIYERIRKEIKEGNCKCEITNPQGSCCLSNVANIIQIYQG